MQKGDLSNEFQPCLLVVFEGLLGLPPRETGRKSWWKREKSNAKSIVATYEINKLLVGQINRVKYPVEVVTFLGPNFVPPIALLLEERHVLARAVWYTTPEELARIHLERPDVAAIYDPDRSRAFATYGGLGRHLPPALAPRFGE